jgi:UDP-glucuronate decarboxylase
MEGLVTRHPAPSVARRSASDVVNEDLDYMRDRLEAEFSAMAGRRLLITGGAGFLGYYLVQAVLHWNLSARSERRIAVTVFDNYMRGVPSWLGALAGDPDLTLVRHDITHPLPREMPRFEYIIHAASIASPIYYRRFPIETMDANVGGLRRLLDHAVDRRAGSDPIQGFLFYSTSEIYGDPRPEHIPTSETYRGHVSCTGPRACYDESKRYGETLCVNFARVHDLPVKIARPFNNYGPGLKINDRRVIPDFARDILAERDIVMLSDGSPTRTYCYVADAVIGYFKVLVNGRSGEPYNIGVESPEISIRDLADRMVTLARRTFGYTGRVVQQASMDADYLTDNPNRRCPRITKAREELGYDPGIDLDDGLLRSLLWYRDHPSAEEA